MLGKNLLSSVLTQVPIFLLGIVSGVFSTRILGEDAKGAFSLFQANYLLFLLFFSFGIQTGIVYFISSKKYTEEVIAGISTTIFTVSSLALLLLLFALFSFNYEVILLPVNYTKTEYLIALFFLFFFSFLNSLITSFFQARSMFKIINWVSIINSLLNATFFIILYSYFKHVEPRHNAEKFNYVLVSSIILLIINSLLWLYLFKTKINIKPKFTSYIYSIMKDFTSYSLLIYIGMFINFFNYRLDLWIVNYYSNEKDLSYYSLATNIVQIILYISVTIGSVILPNLSNYAIEERIKNFTLISRFSFTFFLALVLIAISSASLVIPFMYGMEFEKTIIPFQILSIGILFSCITQIFSMLLVSSNQNKYNIIACSIGLVFTVLFDLLLIPQYGIIGASIATLISYFVIFALTYFIILKKLDIKSKNLFIPSKENIKYILEIIEKHK